MEHQTAGLLILIVILIMITMIMKMIENSTKVLIMVMAAPDENHDKEDGNESEPKRFSQHSLLEGNLFFIKVMMPMKLMMIMTMTI